MQFYPEWNYVGAWGKQWIDDCKHNDSRTFNRKKYWVQRNIGDIDKFMCRLAYERIKMYDKGDHYVLCCIDRLELVC